VNKLVRLVKRREGGAPADFASYWMERHRRLPGAHRTVLSLATGEVALGGQSAPFDGMSAIYYDTVQETRAALSAFDAEDPRFADGAAVALVAEEHLMSQKADAGRTPRPGAQLKIIRTVYRRRDLTPEQFKDYWLKNHARLEDRVIAESPVQRIVATFAVPEPGRDPAFDGMVELYFASLADIRAMFAGPIPAMMRKDEENFVQMDAPAIRFVAEEHVLEGR
jgi:uncharacterized protein (TIGR02118 family)